MSCGIASGSKTSASDRIKLLKPQQTMANEMIALLTPCSLRFGRLKHPFEPEPPGRHCLLLLPRTAALGPLRRTMLANFPVKFTLNQTDLVFNYF
jgi:hypothetical protein